MEIHGFADVTPNGLYVRHHLPQYFLNGMPIRCGIALHVGEVVYGNIGTPGRLDFTVIGEAVNRVARVESLCGPLGEVLLATDEFSQSVDCGRTSVGSHVLKGIDEAVEVFRLDLKPTV